MGGGYLRVVLLRSLAHGQFWVEPGGGNSAIEEGVVSGSDAEARANADAFAYAETLKRHAAVKATAQQAGVAAEAKMAAEMHKAKAAAAAEKAERESIEAPKAD